MDIKKLMAMLLGVLYVALVLFLITPAPARAATACDEWANMTKVLVMRWQADPGFHGKTGDQVKAKLEQMMGGHPDLHIAKKWTDYAYRHKDEDPVQVWKNVYAQCGKVPM